MPTTADKATKGNYMGEIVIMGIGFDRPTVTVPMTATKEELLKELLKAYEAEAELLPERVGE